MLVEDIVDEVAMTDGVFGTSAFAAQRDRVPPQAGGEAAERARAVRRACLAVAAVAIAAAAVALVILPQRPAAVPPLNLAHQALAAWIIAETDTATVIDVPPDVRADLVRYGVAPQRLGPGGALVVTRGGPGPGGAVARFGEGPEALAVSRPEAPTQGETAVSAVWGQQLLGNPAVRVDDPARAVLRGGRADPRALLVLAVLAARGPVHVLDLPGVPAEDPALPRHQVVLAGLDAGGLAWINTYLRLAHLSPDTPNVDVTITAFDGRMFQLKGVGYGAVSTYQTVDPGTYTVQMRPSADRPRRRS